MQKIIENQQNVSRPTSLLPCFNFTHNDYQILKSGFQCNHSEKDIDKVVF